MGQSRDSNPSLSEQSTVDAATPEQTPSNLPGGRQPLPNPVRGWGLSPGLLTPQPVLLQGAVLPFLLKEVTGTESSPYLQPTEDPADQQAHSAELGAWAWAAA